MRKNIFGVVLFLIGCLLSEILFSIAIAFAFEFLKLNSFLKSEGVNTYFIGTLVTFLHLIFIVFYVYIFKRLSKLELDNYFIKYSIKNKTILFLKGLVFGTVFILCIIGLRYAAGLVKEFHVNSTESQIVMILFYFMGIGFSIFSEEIIFRRTLYMMFRNFAKSYWIAAVMTSITFSIFHLLRNVGLIDILFYFLFSMLLCMLVENTKSIWIGAGLHHGWNYFSDGGQIFALRYKNDWTDILFAKGISLFAILIVIAVYIYIMNSRRGLNQKGEVSDVK